MSKGKGKSAIKKSVNKVVKKQVKIKDDKSSDYDSGSDFGRESSKKKDDEYIEDENEDDEDDNLDDVDIDDEEKNDDDEEEDEEDVWEEEGENAAGNEDGDDCMYSRKGGLSKAMNDIEKDEDDEDMDMDYVNGKEEKDIFVLPEERISRPYLTNYERVRLLADRAAQLSLDAKPMIKGTEGMDPKKIAQLELEQKMIPIVIIRPLPNKMKEKWYLHELKLKPGFIKFGNKE